MTDQQAPELKCVMNGREIGIKLSGKAQQELNELKEKICNPCPLRVECNGKRCLIRL